MFLFIASYYYFFLFPAFSDSSSALLTNVVRPLLLFNGLDSPYFLTTFTLKLIYIPMLSPDSPPLTNSLTISSSTLIHPPQSSLPCDKASGSSFHMFTCSSSYLLRVNQWSGAPLWVSASRSINLVSLFLVLSQSSFVLFLLYAEYYQSVFC